MLPAAWKDTHNDPSGPQRYKDRTVPLTANGGQRGTCWVRDQQNGDHDETQSRKGGSGGVARSRCNSGRGALLKSNRRAEHPEW